MRVSVIITVKNEEASIGPLLDSMLAQTRPPDEVILADGGSTDRTRAIALSYVDRGLPLRLVDASGSNISQGRNAAIRVATGEAIASTDAGVRLAPEWLAELVGPLEKTKDGGRRTEDGERVSPSPSLLRTPYPDATAGFFQADARTLFEVAMGATVLPDLVDVQSGTFLPSSRSVAFTKEAWERVGGYPEWLDYCEDLVFDRRLRAAGYRFAFAPKAVAHYRPRSSLRAFFRQYYHYARGDGKADLWRKRHAARYSAYLLATPVLLVLSAWRSPLWLLPLLVGGLAYAWTPYRRLWPRLANRTWPERLRAVLLVPVIRVTGDVAKMLGYPAGWVWRWQHRGESLA